MPSPIRFSRTHRYSRSRVRLLLRPRVWLSAVVPVLALALAWAYWQRPALLSNWLGDRPLEFGADSSGDRALPPGLFESNPTGQGRSLGDRAQIDIDNLPVLGARRFPTGTPLALEEPLVSSSDLPDALKSPSQAGSSSSLPASSAIALTNLLLLNPAPTASRSSRGSAKPDPILNTITVSPTTSPITTSSILPSPAIAPAGTVSTVGTVSSPIPGSTPSQPVLPVSPLESALQRQAGSSSPPSTVEPSPAGSSGTSPRIPGTVPSGSVLQPIPGEPAQPLSQPSLTPAFSTPTLPGPYLPRTSPPPGSTGYLPPLGVQPLPTSTLGQPIGAPAPLPSGLPVPDSSISGSGISGAGAAGFPGGNSSVLPQPQFDGRNFYTAPTQPAQPPTVEAAPFSAPSRPRNGEFNTFSNP
ncbi:hypothetical protein HPC62_08220 [Thermoleptolyngbya sichuanensis A183]|uniref:Uncharacterized protein n=1 Tax=Thermoleptolyngbya sichuanensis A183 TaxID=2737172 RepID=A0A6M8BGA4_9CYAN|nr:hypothetical protein [Thermoleptolyngbya sichuanensis]QKD82183.1 hypothetical protein HPC62_08220 [Thermoleptolyngbya sichuanensis A183]